MGERCLDERSLRDYGICEEFIVQVWPCSASLSAPWGQPRMLFQTWCDRVRSALGDAAMDTY